MIYVNVIDVFVMGVVFECLECFKFDEFVRVGEMVGCVVCILDNGFVVVFDFFEVM